MSWIKDIFDPGTRKWEEFYRNRWQHDKVVRSTHGVNCTGGCSWMVAVKDGIVTWETQALDYPSLQPGLPPYEPRGCQRGISTSWYIYSPLRVKYPYARGALLDLWRSARSRLQDPVAAWASIVEDDDKRAYFHTARGKGGLRRITWSEAEEMIAAATIYTIKHYGPDRLVGFSPIPAMSMLSYAAGTRFLQLMGGVSLSFYDWYADLPNAFPETWGEQTDVCESADWYNSKFTVVMGSNPSMTRTPDVHFLSEGRYHGAKLVVLSPDFQQTSKYADWWLPVAAGQDGAFWMAVDHVILKEFVADRRVPYFESYLKRYSDMPFLVALEEGPGGYRAGRFLRAGLLSRYKGIENGEWKLLVFDRLSGELRTPQGTIGFRWAHEKGKWNLEPKDGLDGSEIDPVLTLIEDRDDVVQVRFSETGGPASPFRGVPVKYVQTDSGRVAVTTVLDLLMAQFGVSRGLPGGYPQSYDDDLPYTPAWQEKLTGIDRATLIRFAREFASNAERTEGRSMVIIGTGVNQWYHSNLMYRAAITALVLCGCVGRNGGGLNHYVGQEKLVPFAPWSVVAFGTDWIKPPRLQNTPSFQYMNSDQWRYDAEFTRYNPLPGAGRIAPSHVADMQVKATRLGWLPSYPQFNRSPLQMVQDALAAGATTNAEIVSWVVSQLRAGRGDGETGGQGEIETVSPSPTSPVAPSPLRFAVEDPDAPENWPRMLFIWRGNFLMASAKGHEFQLKHLLGTHTNAVAAEVAEGKVEDVVWREAPKGKYDLVVDLNFRMDTSALYSDIVLPSATWYEKADLNTTDLHSFIHPLGEAVTPCWESRSDWEIFKALARKVSDLARTHLPDPVADLVAVPLQHDSPDELAQPVVLDWAKGEVDPVPGKTMPNLRVVERDYVNLYNRFVSLGPTVRSEGIGAHGISWPVDDLYDRMVATRPFTEWGGARYPSMSNVVDAANAILYLAPETNGEVSYRAFQAEEAKTGVRLVDLAEPYRGVTWSYADLVQQPRRILNSPCWSGIVTDGRAYTGFAMNVDRLIPWRTLTGRQQLYLDHELYIEFGQNMPTYRLKPGPFVLNELEHSPTAGGTLLANILTPHGKWHIHSTFMDNHRMLTLSRGVEPCWINDLDAAEIGVVDNDWVEVYNDNGVVVTRAAVSARIPRGVSFYYHAPERTVSVPRSPIRGNRRAGGHNSLTRIRLNPILMAGGQAQFTYAFNYWGPTGVTRDTFVYIRKLPELNW
ncbi:MAG TPA: nitrate reductase subunit alpha [Chloroflexota bacterium]